MPDNLYPDSSAIIKQAIKALGLGNKGLADKLKKDPSLISRYASGLVRPKAETLLQCMKYINADKIDLSKSPSSTSESSRRTLDLIKTSVNQLSAETDAELINTLYSVLKLANK